MDYSFLKSGTDIRGRALGDDVQLTGAFARRLGGAFVLWLRARGEETVRVAIGRDSRVTGESLLSDCAEGMARMGADVIVFGLCTTPAMYVSILDGYYQNTASVMVTASHHPFDRNGFKFFDRQGGVSAKQLDEILAQMDNVPNEDADVDIPQGAVSHVDYLPRYRDSLMQRVRKGLDTTDAMPLLGLHVLVDAGNGAGGFYAHMLKELGAWVEGSQFLEPDGYFPNHIPNPENAEAMASLRDAVLRYGADIGVIFDADCDRAAIVDQNGREINRNRLIALISAILLDQQPGLTIVTDSVTSSGLATFITEWGGVHYRFKRGYRNVIDEAIRLNESGIDCPLAIETSGHAALRENHFLDDGMYLATVLLVEAMRLKRQGRTLGDLIAELREPVESVELRLKINAPDFRAVGRAAIEQVMDYAAFAPDWHIAPDSREGVRINFDLGGARDNGWFLLRLSVHDPVMPLNIESDIAGGTREMARALLKVLRNAQGIDLAPLEQYAQND